MYRRILRFVLVLAVVQFGFAPAGALDSAFAAGTAAMPADCEMAVGAASGEQDGGVCTPDMVCAFSCGTVHAFSPSSGPAVAGSAYSAVRLDFDADGLTGTTTAPPLRPPRLSIPA